MGGVPAALSLGSTPSYDFVVREQQKKQEVLQQGQSRKRRRTDQGVEEDGQDQKKKKKNGARDLGAYMTAAEAVIRQAGGRSNDGVPSEGTTDEEKDKETNSVNGIHDHGHGNGSDGVDDSTLR